MTRPHDSSSNPAVTNNDVNMFPSTFRMGSLEGGGGKNRNRTSHHGGGSVPIKANPWCWDGGQRTRVEPPPRPGTCNDTCHDVLPSHPRTFVRSIPSCAVRNDLRQDASIPFLAVDVLVPDPSATTFGDKEHAPAGPCPSRWSKDEGLHPQASRTPAHPIHSKGRCDVPLSPLGVHRSNGADGRVSDVVGMRKMHFSGVSSTGL